MEQLPRVLATELSTHINQNVLVRGWLHNLRSMGKINFLILRDRTGYSQIVIEDKEVLKQLKPLFSGSVLTVVGTVITNAQAEIGCEIIQPTITIESAVTTPPPVEYYKPDFSADLETILDNRSVALRNAKIAAVFEIQATIVHAYQVFMREQVQATAYYAPCLIGASSEGGAEFFNVDYFGHLATLAQSSQLYKQMMVGVYERVYAVMPFFRAENSNTARHLTEGKQFEFEMGFFQDWREILDIEEACIKYIAKEIQEKNARALKTLGHTLVAIPEDKAFPRVTFAEAQEIYFKRTGTDERAEPDLSPAAERELCKYALEAHGTSCIFVTDWKTSKRPFYAFPTPGNPELSNTFDLLCAGTEITSGGQRRHTYESMLEGLALKGMNPESFTDYLNIFKFGMPAHGGFGLGLERLTMTLLQLPNVREASLFPSDTKRIAGNRIKAKIFTGQENIRNEFVRRAKEADITLSNDEQATPIKCVIAKLKTSRKNVLAVLRANDRIDFKLLAEITGEKCEFEAPEIVSERYSLDVKETPPYGNLFGCKVYFEEQLKDSAIISFFSAKPGEKFSAKTEQISALCEADFCKIAKVENT